MEKNCITKYVTDHGNVELSPEIIKSYLVPPDSKITDPEIGFFLQMCKFQKLNPFMKEIYIVKFGNLPAAFIVAKDTFLRRAKKNKTYRGHTVAISDDGKTAWAEVFIQDFEKPIKCEVDYEEYVGKKSNGEINRMWTEKPRTMLKKVALVQALREAFPQDLGGLYDQSEVTDPDEVIKEANAVVKEAETKSDTETSEKKSSESPQSNAKRTDDTKASKTTGEALEVIVKIKNITQTKRDTWKGPRYNIEAVGGTIYTTFVEQYAKDAAEIKGKDAEALIIYVLVEDKYYNIIGEGGFKLI